MSCPTTFRESTVLETGYPMNATYLQTIENGLCGVTGVVPTGVTGVVPTGVTGTYTTGITGVVPTGVTGVYPTGVTGVYPTGVTGGYPTGVTGVYPTGVTGGYPTGVTGVYPTGVTGVYPTGVTGVYPTGVTGVLPTELTGLTTAFGGLTTGNVEPFWTHEGLNKISTLPRLFPYSGCTESVVEKVIEQIRGVPTDLATHCMLHPTSVLPVGTHPYRGFTVLNGKQTITEVRKCELTGPRPVCLVFNGIGSQWYGIGQELMTLDVFRQSIMRCVEVLRPYGINLLDLIHGKQHVFEQTLNSFVGITAVQIALIDCLRHVGVVPEFYIGHSIGELACAYADNCLTYEQALLTAFHCGKHIGEVQWPVNYVVARVGLTWEEVARRCPTGVVPTWQHTHEWVTVCGPRTVIVPFVKELTYEGIFAKVDETITVPFHSTYMTPIVSQLKTVLDRIICTPKMRTSRWISSSIPEPRWTTELGRYFSPEYFLNNLCSPVLFNESVRRLPVNCVVVEVGPHTMLEGLLRRTLGVQVPVIPLVQRDVVYPLEHFLTQLGKLYLEGVNLDAVKLVVPLGREHTVYPLPVHVTTGPFSKWVKCEHLTNYPTLGEWNYPTSVFPQPWTVPTTGLPTPWTLPTTVVPQPWTLPTTFGMENVCFNPIQTYVITGGLAGFGLELAHWMVEHGARRIVITSKVGVRTDYQVRKIKILRDEFNAQIQVLPLDVTQELECLTLIREAAQMSIENKIGGIFHLSGLWEDMPYEIQQTMQKVQIQQQLRQLVEGVRCLGAWNLDKCLRTECVMDDSAYFCVFVPVFGTQTVVPTTYTTLEKLCELRRREGKHWLNVQWGFNGELGLTTDYVFGGVDTEEYPIVNTTGIVTVPRRIVSCLRVLETLLIKSCEPRETALYSCYVPIEKILNQEVYQPWTQPKSLVEYILTILGVRDVKQVLVNEHITLGELGLTEVLCVEIKKVFEQIYNLPFTPVEIQQLTINKIRSIEKCQHPTRIFPTTVFPTVRYPTVGYPTVGYPTVGYPTVGYPTVGYPMVGYPTTVVPKVFNYTIPTRVIERLNHIELTPNTVPLVVIHPIEGHVDMLRTWAKHIQVPVFGVQFTQEAMQYETIEQLGEFYWTQIQREIFTPTWTTVPRVHLCGLSFGAQVAYEIAARRNHLIASLTFLDGSHYHFNHLVTVLRQQYTVERIHQIESEILFNFLHQHLPTVVYREIIQELVRLPTLEQRIFWVVRELLTKGQTTFTKVELETVVRLFVVKMLMAIKYQPRQTLKFLKEINLIKSLTCPTVFGQDLGLGQVFGGKLNVHVVDCELPRMFESTHGLKVANIFNKYLPRWF